jgi:putative chitinase
MTTQQLKDIIGNIYYEQKLQTLTDSINQVVVKYGINTNLRLAHFLAQVIHESGKFKYNTELATGDAYDTRTDLGNTPEKDGDGRTYKGRGYIQITGRSNYKAVSKALGVDFLKTPTMLANPPYDMLSAGWYWDLKKLNTYADQDDATTITKKINGGLNGYSDRLYWLKKCKEVLK